MARYKARFVSVLSKDPATDTRERYAFDPSKLLENLRNDFPPSDNLYCIIRNEETKNLIYDGMLHPKDVSEVK